MKKLLLVALAAVGMASCVQTEELAVAGSTTAIAFGDSYVYNATKADPTTTTASISSFDVWAFMDNVGGTVLTDEDVTKVNGVWGYSNLQYWAPNHTYYFAALSPMNTQNITSKTLATGEAAKLGLGEIAYTNPNGTEDLLYAKATAETPSMSQLAAQGMDAVAMQFQHLLSKVKFTFKNGFLTNNMKVVVTNVHMTAPESATINLAQADYSKAWELGTGAIDLAFGDAAGEQLAAGASASTVNTRLTIPASSAYEYTVTFDVVVYSGTVKAFEETGKKATIKGYELAMGKAYNFTAVINADSFGLQPIEFTAEVDEWSTEIPGNAEVVVGELVRDAQSLVNAIANGGKNGVVTLGNDVALTEAIELPAGKKVTLDLNGNTIEGAFTKGGDGANAMVKNNGTLTIVGGTIKNSTENGDAAIYNTGDLVLEGVKIEGAPIGTTGYPEYAVYTVGGTLVVNDTEIAADRGAIRLEAGADVTINGGSYTVTDAIGTRVLTAHVIYANGSASKLTINGGEFAQNIANGGGTSVICPAGATIKIYGGNFYHAPVADFQSKIFQNYMGYGAPVDVYGGTYNDDSVTKSGNLADGYKAVEANGKYVVVADDVDAVASTPAEVLSAIKVEGQTVCVMPTADGSAHKLEGKMSLASGVSLIGIGDEPVALFNDWGSNAFGKQAHFTNTTVENINFTNNLVIDAGIANGNVHFKNCVFGGDRAHQGVHFDSGNATIVFDNCTFVGRNMLGASLTKVIFNNCTFLNKKSSQTAADLWTGVNMWGKYEFNDCVFDTEATCNVKCDGVEATFTNCKYIDNRNIEEVVNNYAGYPANIIIDGELLPTPVSTKEQFTNALSAGGSISLQEDIDVTKIDLTTLANDVIIDANGKTIKTASNYGVQVTAGKNITLKNAKVEITVAGDYITYAAGLKIENGDYQGNTITLKDCEIRMCNDDWAYAVNMPASVKNLNLVIDGCTLEGAIALQCWGDNNTITATNSHFICNYKTNAMYTSYCVVLQGDGTYKAENNTLNIRGCEFSYSGVDNFNSVIKAVSDVSGAGNNTITVVDCTYNNKVAAYQE